MGRAHSPGCIWDWPGDVPTGTRVWDRQSGPRHGVPRPLPPRGPGGTSSASSCFYELPDNQSLSTHCWPRFVWLRNIFKRQALFIPVARAAVDHSHCRGGGRGLGPRAGQGRGRKGKMRLTPRVEVVPAALPFWPSGHQLESSSDRSCNSPRPKLHVHPLVSTATLGIASVGLCKGAPTCVCLPHQFSSSRTGQLSPWTTHLNPTPTTISV